MSFSPDGLITLAMMIALFYAGFVCGQLSMKWFCLSDSDTSWEELAPKLKIAAEHLRNGSLTAFKGTRLIITGSFPSNPKKRNQWIAEGIEQVLASAEKEIAIRSAHPLDPEPVPNEDDR